MATVASAPEPSTVAPPPLQSEARRVQQLRAGKRRATGLLLVMAVTFIVVVLLFRRGVWGTLSDLLGRRTGRGHPVERSLGAGDGEEPTA